jgi:hypothetical protein
MLVGLATIILTFWGTANYVFPFYSHTYPFAWYGLILFLDGLLWWRWDKGIVFRTPLRFITLLFWSAVFWFFFEIWNLRLQNWYYAGVPPNGPWAHIEAYLDFATVLPGMFLVFELLHCLKIPRQLTTPFRLSIRLRKYWTFTGLVMLVLPLVYPDVFFPFVWGALIFLLEPLCAKFGGPSLLRDAENGEWTTMVRLLFAGILCGGYWEFWNYWSLEKWIYTVPFFSEGKLFEMPYLGFLGFPPFCVQCFVMTNAVLLVQRSHRNGGFPQNIVPKPASKLAYRIMIILGLVLSELSYSQMEKHTIDSRSESLQQILGDMSTDDAQRLQAQGWHYPKQILNNRQKAGQVIVEPVREAVLRRLELSAILHMGSANARLLEGAGVFSREVLAKQDPDLLFKNLLEANRILDLRESPILKRRVSAWIEGAKRNTPLY